jgi:hypothetical protein
MWPVEWFKDHFQSVHLLQKVGSRDSFPYNRHHRSPLLLLILCPVLFFLSFSSVCSFVRLFVCSSVRLFVRAPITCPCPISYPSVYFICLAFPLFFPRTFSRSFRPRLLFLNLPLRIHTPAHTLTHAFFYTLVHIHTTYTTPSRLTGN